MTHNRRQLYKDILHTGMLLLAAFIWGMAFSAQSIGADYVGGWTFLTARSILAVLVMLPFVIYIDKQRIDSNPQAADTNHPNDTVLPVEIAKTSRHGTGRQRHTAKASIFPWWSDWKAGIICGIFLCVASGMQQIGIAYTTTAKSGFITALYVVIVPVITLLILRRRQSGKIWLCIALCVVGLYLLCMTNGFESISIGDLLTLGSAFGFSCQILFVSHYVTRVGALRLTFLQFVVELVIAAVLMLLFEHPTIEGLRAAAIPILYAGIMSSAVGYSLQSIGQQRLNPTVASLAMCMESVFSALGGWLILGQTLRLREGIGCALMFAAILLSELPVEQLFPRFLSARSDDPDDLE